MGQGSCVGRIYHYYFPKQEKLVFHPNFNHPPPISSHQTCVMALSSVTIKQCVQNILIKQLSEVNKDWGIVYNEEVLQSLKTLFGSASVHFQLHCAQEREKRKEKKWCVVCVVLCVCVVSFVPPHLHCISFINPALFPVSSLAFQFLTCS